MPSDVNGSCSFLPLRKLLSAVSVVSARHCVVRRRKDILCLYMNSPLTTKRVWWLLSDFLVVLTQQYWFWTNDYMLALCKAYFIGLCAHLDAMALFHWIVQNQDCWLSTTKKSINTYQTLFLVRGQGLGMRLSFPMSSPSIGSGTLLRCFIVEKTSCMKFSRLLTTAKTFNSENFPIYGIQKMVQLHTWLLSECDWA